MRIVIDLQAAQSPGSRVRGIGRYSLALAEAMAKLAAGEHEIWIALNHAVADAIEPLRARFAPWVGEQRVVVWESLPGVPGADADARQRRTAAELLRERFLAQLAPDIVHVSSLFEGWSDDTVTSVGRLPGDPLQVVTLYDLIPYVRRETYLGDQRVRSWYMEKIRHLSSADLLLAISDFTRQEAIDVLALPPSRVINISGACDQVFHRLGEHERRRIEARVRSRHRLAGNFVLYTGGFDDRKNIDGLIRAFAALPPELRIGRQLAIIGHGPMAEVERLRTIATESGLGAGDVVFTGYVDDADLCALYNFCDLYVFPSFHEGFGLPVLEAMACGAPVIGSRTTSLVEVIGFEAAMFDPASCESMTGLIRDCLENEGFREELRRHAEVQVARFSWNASAERALTGMIAARGSAVRTKPVRGDAALEATAVAMAQLIDGDDEYARLRRPLARALALNHRSADRMRRLFVDVTMLADVDVGTGIQRVVRNILRELLSAPPEGFEIAPVRLIPTVGYVHARAFAARFAGLPEGPDSPIDPHAGDLVLGLDLIAHLLPDNQTYFTWLRERGVALWFVIYDLLPVLRPEYFPPGGLGVFQRWYHAVGEVADGVLCISRAVAEELAEWYDQIQPTRLRSLRIGHFHLGADLQREAGDPAVAPAALRDYRTFLMVGTVERRKGHAQVLAAFERLWSRGIDVRLVIVGKQGWLVDELVSRLRLYAEDSGRVVWLEHASDRELLDLYASASALLMASEGEGFGLPLIEAAQHGVPLIARDLPVFREVAGNGAFYFEGDDADALADAIEQWLVLRAQDRHPKPGDISWLTWSQSAACLRDVMLGGEDGISWEPGRRYVITAADPRIASQNGVLQRGVLRPQGGAPGYLVYGPYSQVAEGQYEVRVVLDVPDGTSRAILDVTALASDEVLYHRDLSQAPVTGGRLELVFELVVPRPLDRFQVRLLLPAEDGTGFINCTLTPSGRARPHGEESTKSTKEPIDA
jgi:glycosyltransferase involved in cell wall biosynthesis